MKSSRLPGFCEKRAKVGSAARGGFYILAYFPLNRTVSALLGSPSFPRRFGDVIPPLRTVFTDITLELWSHKFLPELYKLNINTFEKINQVWYGCSRCSFTGGYVQIVKDWETIQPKSDDALLLEEVGLGDNLSHLRFVIEVGFEDFFATRVTARGIQLRPADWNKILMHLSRTNQVAFHHLREFAEQNHLVPLHMIPVAV